MSKFTKPALADAFYDKHKGAPFFTDLSTYMQSDVVTGMELVAGNAIESLRELLGPTDAAQAKKEAPGSLRAAFGTDVMRNAVTPLLAPLTTRESSVCSSPANLLPQLPSTTARAASSSLM